MWVSVIHTCTNRSHALHFGGKMKWKLIFFSHPAHRRLMLWEILLSSWCFPPTKKRKGNKGLGVTLVPRRVVGLPVPSTVQTSAAEPSSLSVFREREQALMVLPAEPGLLALALPCLAPGRLLCGLRPACHLLRKQLLSC